jgi:hypothetical protein
MTMFSLTEDSKGKSLAIFFDDGLAETIPETHVAFKPILEKLIDGSANDETVRELIQPLVTVAAKMSALSERVSVDGKQVFFDGDPLRGELSDVIRDMFVEGNTNFGPLVNFLEKAKTNPSLKSVDDLYRWIRNGDLVIDPEGYLVAYKGVKVDSDGTSLSISSGTALVDGQKVTGCIPNRPGTVISMPRSEVNDDELVACSTGLHAGTYQYASQFAQGRLLLVKINPRDVVSVPADSADQKIRCSRYTVLTEIEHRLESHVYQPQLWEDDEDFEDYDDSDIDDDYGYEEDDEDYESYAAPEEVEDYLSEPLAEWERELLGLPLKDEEPVTEEEPEEEAEPVKRNSAGRRIL